MLFWAKFDCIGKKRLYVNAATLLCEAFDPAKVIDSRWDLQDTLIENGALRTFCKYQMSINLV